MHIKRLSKVKCSTDLFKVCWGPCNMHLSSSVVSSNIRPALFILCLLVRPFSRLIGKAASPIIKFTLIIRCVWNMPGFYFYNVLGTTPLPFGNFIERSITISGVSTQIWGSPKLLDDVWCLVVVIKVVPLFNWVDKSLCSLNMRLWWSFVILVWCISNPLLFTVNKDQGVVLIEDSFLSKYLLLFLLYYSSTVK